MNISENRRHECMSCKYTIDDKIFKCVRCNVRLCKKCQCIGNNNNILCWDCNYAIYLTENLIQCEICKNVWDGNAQCNCVDWYISDESLEKDEEEKDEKEKDEKKVKVLIINNFTDT